jgi:hypothetical protein
LKPRRQLLLAELAIAVLIELAEALEHGPTTGRAAAPAANRIAAPTRS